MTRKRKPHSKVETYGKANLRRKPPKTPKSANFVVRYYYRSQADELLCFDTDRITRTKAENSISNQTRPSDFVDWEILTIAQTKHVREGVRKVVFPSQDSRRPERIERKRNPSQVKLTHSERGIKPCKTDKRIASQAAKLHSPKPARAPIDPNLLTPRITLESIKRAERAIDRAIDAAILETCKVAA